MGQRLSRIVACVVAVLLSLVSVGRVSAGPTTFVYQGRLEDGGQPATGTFDMRFGLFATSTGGPVIGSYQCVDNVVVTNGLFSVELDLVAPSSGADTFLQVETRADTGLTCGNTSGLVALTPRVKLGASPKAVYSLAVPANSPTLPGAIRFHPTLREFQGYDGAFWYPLSVGAAVVPTNSPLYATPGASVFVVPAGVTRLGVDIWGAGGGGGGSGAGSAAPTSGACTAGTGGYGAGGGGGGGGGAGRYIIEVTPGETLLLDVGVGGTAGAVGQPGASGGVTRVRRGGVALITAASGSPGAAGTMVVMGSGSCNGSPGGAGGAPGAAPTLAGTTTLTEASLPGLASSGGTGPSCTSTFPNPTLWCPASGGQGGGTRSLSTPLAVDNSGAGGSGGRPGLAATSGSAGRIRLFWY
jgi:hypothetical protein